MVQGFLNPIITFLGEKLTGSLKPKMYQCYKRKNSKNANKKRKNENFEKQKNSFFSLMSQGTLNLKIRPLGQKVCLVARVQTDGQTDTKVNTEGTLSGFQEFFLQPIIKDRPNTVEIFIMLIPAFSFHNNTINTILQHSHGKSPGIIF